MSTYIFELAITHTVLILAYWVFLSRERQYATMRFYLLASTLFSIIIPLFRLPKLFPTEIQPVQELPTELIEIAAPTVAAATEATLITFDMLMWISLLISCIFLSKLLIRIVSLVKLERRSIAELCDGISIRRVPNVNGSSTFFNWIFLSSGIDNNHKEYNAILKHERAHANLGHSYDRIFFEIYKALFWWLPSSWYINREIEKLHEYQADACVLRSFNIDLYATILIKSTLQSNGLNIASSFQEV